MELEGNLVIHRKPARWWAAALAVTLPVLACVAGVAWFIRGYISPPTIRIPGSMAAVQGDSIVGPSTSETSADTAPAAAEASTSATLAAASVFPAPPWPADAPPASRTTTEPATVDIPIPRPRPRRVMAETVAAVPLPRPRPREETNAQEPEETSSPPTQEINSVSRPTHERHGAE